MIKSLMDSWMQEMGFCPVFDNHPNHSPREYHWEKEGVRVIWKNNREDVNVYMDILSGKVEDSVGLMSMTVALLDTEGLLKKIEHIKTIAEIVRVHIKH